MKFTDKQYRELADLLKIKLSPYIPHVPHPTQHAFLWLDHVQEVFYGGSAGGGKALAIDTPIATPSGWTTMADLTPGDLVYDADGFPTEVLACSEIMVGKSCYRLEFDDGTNIVADAEHLWKAETVRDRVAAGGRDRDYNLYSTELISKTVRHGPLRTNYSIRTHKPLRGPHLQLPVDPYLLGAWLGDGRSAIGSMCLHEQGMFDQLGACGAVIRPSGRFWHVKGLTDGLRQAGVIHNKHIPMPYLRASGTQRLALLQGLMDTDGSCDSRGQCSFTTTFEALAWGFYELLMSLGIRAGVPKAMPSYLNGIRKKDRYRFKFTTELPAFRLTRKLDLQKREGFRATYGRKYIKACEPVDSVPVRCIKVGVEDGMFLAGRQMVPTHNSDALLMAALQYVDVPGYNAILFRKTFADLNLPGSLIPRAKEWLTGSDAQWNENDSRFTFPSGSTLSFGYMRNDEDRMRYRSAEFSFCVAKGTGILMGDGSLRAIQDIRIGDKVQTLIGPKDVSAVHRVGVRTLASILTPLGRSLVSTKHSLLTPYGWVSPAEMTPTLYRFPDTPSEVWVQKYPVGEKHTLYRSEDLLPLCEPVQPVSAGMARPASCAMEVVSGESCGKEYAALFPVTEQPPLVFVPLMLYGYPLPKTETLQNDPEHDELHAWPAWLSEDSCADYLRYRPDHDERCTCVGESSLGSTPRLSETGLPSRAYLHEGGPKISPLHTRRELPPLVHPYTKERMDPSCRVNPWPCLLAPAGAGEVWDLTVSEASHYILANRAISCNCGFDELTTFSKLQYTYMFSRLRRPQDLGSRSQLSKVPIRMRSASNPGDRGHLWVKNRFIKPMGQRDDEPEDPRQRIYIPARLQDNPSVDADAYIQALQELDDSTKAQLIHGDWDAREPGPWVIPDPTWVDAAVQLGYELWEAGKGVPRDWNKPVTFGIDWGEFTQAYILWPMPNGGIYVMPSEVRGEHEDAVAVTLRILGRSDQIGIKPDIARYDAAGIQNMRVFAATARKQDGWERLKTQKIPFNKYKRETITYLRLLFRRVAAGKQDRIIAIHPENQHLIRQLRGWRRKADESEEVDKAYEDHGPDAIVAGVAPTAAAHRAYIEAMVQQAKQRKKEIA